MDIQGKIIEIQDTVQIKDTFQKREFIVEYAENPSYPEFLKFELIQDKCAILNNFQQNDDVTVHFNLKGRRWTDRNGEVKYFNSLQAWKVEPAGGSAPAQGNSGPSDIPPPPEPISGPDDDDVLPF